MKKLLSLVLAVSMAAPVVANPVVVLTGEEEKEVAAAVEQQLAEVAKENEAVAHAMELTPDQKKWAVRVAGTAVALAAVYGLWKWYSSDSQPSQLEQDVKTLLEAVNGKPGVAEIPANGTNALVPAVPAVPSLRDAITQGLATLRTDVNGIADARIAAALAAEDAANNVQAGAIRQAIDGAVAAAVADLPASVQAQLTQENLRAAVTALLAEDAILNAIRDAMVARLQVNGNNLEVR